MLQWVQRQHESLGPIPTTSVRAEVCRRKGKIMGDKTWQTWAQDFRSFFPEVTLNVANKWTNSNCVESKSSDCDKDVEEDKEFN